MKRALLILVAGVVLACAAYCGVYFLATAPERSLQNSATPELAWLKKEFHLSDAEFKRISELHAAYLPECGKMCQLIADKNAELRELLAKHSQMSPEIESNLAASAQIRAQCEAAMLKHFYAVSQTMPPDEGKRYLRWVQEQTFGSMQQMTAAAVPSHDHGH